MARRRSGGVVFANLLAVVKVINAKVWIGRATVGRDAMVCRVVDPAIRIMSILVARAVGGGGDGGGDGCSGDDVLRR